MAEGNASDGIAELRSAYDELKTNFESLFKEHRGLQAQVAVEAAGLNPKHAELFLMSVGDGDVTAKAAKDFAKSYDLPTGTPAPPAADGGEPEGNPQPSNQPEGRPGQEPVQAQPGMAGMAGAGKAATGPNPPSSEPKKLSQAEFQALYVKDKAKALEAYRAGHVERSDNNAFTQEAG